MQYDWAEETTAILRSELDRKHVGWVELVELLRVLDVEETVSSVKNKVLRGNFTFKFFLQCMLVIGADELLLKVSFSELLGSARERFERVQAVRATVRERAGPAPRRRQRTRGHGDRFVENGHLGHLSAQVQTAPER